MWQWISLKDRETIGELFKMLIAYNKDWVGFGTCKRLGSTVWKIIANSLPNMVNRKGGIFHSQCSSLVVHLDFSSSQTIEFLPLWNSHSTLPNIYASVRNMLNKRLGTQIDLIHLTRNWTCYLLGRKHELIFMRQTR